MAFSVHHVPRLLTERKIFRFKQVVANLERQLHSLEDLETIRNSAANNLGKILSRIRKILCRQLISTEQASMMMIYEFEFDNKFTTYPLPPPSPAAF